MAKSKKSQPRDFVKRNSDDVRGKSSYEARGFVKRNSGDIKRDSGKKNSSEGWEIVEPTRSPNSGKSGRSSSSSSSRSSSAVSPLEEKENYKKDVGKDSVTLSALSTIQSLTQALAGFPNVEQVRAVAENPGDLYEITFEILSYQVDFPESRELAERATALVIDTEWELCDVTDSENWHFGTQILRRFNPNSREDKIVALSYARP